MTVLSFYSTPDETLGKLKALSVTAFEEYVAHRNAIYQEYKKIDKYASMDQIYYEPIVYSFGEFVAKLSEEHPDDFPAFYRRTYNEIGRAIASGQLNYPDATMQIMSKVLDFSNIAEPLVLLGYAPPYYPPIHGDKMSGKEGYATKAYEFLREISVDVHAQPLTYESYYMGLSDLSYCGMDHPFDYMMLSTNTPLWGELYNVDFAALEAINVPAIIYGPIGLDCHQWTERVNKKSLFEVVPHVTKELYEYFWRIE